MRSSSIKRVESSVLGAMPEKIVDTERHAAQAFGGFDFSKVPRGPSFRSLGLMRVSELDKKFPHIWISPQVVPPDQIILTHLGRKLRKCKPVYLQVDTSGYYIGFHNTSQGRSELEACYENHHNKPFFTYRLNMRCFPHGQRPTLAQTNPHLGESAESQSSVQFTSDKVGKGGEITAQNPEKMIEGGEKPAQNMNKVEESGGTPTDDVNKIETGRKTPSDDVEKPGIDVLPTYSGPGAPSDVIMTSPSILGTRTSALQNHDDSSSIKSSKTPSELSSNSQGKSRKCQICKKTSPLDATSLFACSTCRRRFHKGCHKPMIISSSEVWQCYLCDKKTKINMPAASVQAKHVFGDDHFERPSKRAKLENTSTNKTSPLRLELSRSGDRTPAISDDVDRYSGPGGHSQLVSGIDMEQPCVLEIPETPTNGDMSSLTMADKNVPSESPALGAIRSSVHSGGSSNSKKTSLRPNVPYADLIAMALLESPDHRLPAANIYHWIADNVPGYALKAGNWQSGIAVTLTLRSKEGPKAIFEKQLRNTDEPSTGKGKGGWWALRKGAESQFRRWNPSVDYATTSDPSGISWSKNSVSNKEVAQDRRSHQDHQDQIGHTSTLEKSFEAENHVKDTETTTNCAHLARSYEPDGKSAICCQLAVPKTPDSPRATKIEMGGMHSDQSSSSPTQHEQADTAAQQVSREIPDSVDPVVADLMDVDGEYSLTSPTAPRLDEPTATDVHSAADGLNTAIRIQEARIQQDVMPMDSPRANILDVGIPKAAADPGRQDADLPREQERQIVTTDGRHGSTVETPYDLEQRAAILVKEYVRPRFSALSLYEGHPEYLPDGPGHDTEAKAREIRSRPTRKQVFGKTTLSRLAGNDLGSSLKSVKLGCQPGAGSSTQVVQGKSTDVGSDQDRLIREFASLGELLGLPSLVVPMIHENQLAFRDGTQVSLLLVVRGVDDC